MHVPCLHHAEGPTLTRLVWWGCGIGWMGFRGCVQQLMQITSLVLAWRQSLAQRRLECWRMVSTCFLRQIVSDAIRMYSGPLGGISAGSSDNPAACFHAFLNPAKRQDNLVLRA